MSTDRREVILERILTVLATVPGIVTVCRNRAPLSSYDPDTKAPLLPAAVLLDGHETYVGRVATWNHGMHPGPRPPTLMRLEPQVFIVLMPAQDGLNTNIGQQLSAFRISVANAIYNDEELNGYLGANGDIEYLGVITDLQTGDSIRGQARLRFAITYVFDPLDLVT